MSGATLQSSTLTDRSIFAGREVLAGRRRGLRAFLPFAGPALIASVAYMDPGNFATNIQGGARFGYMLLWVVVAANLTAMLFQALSARLGIVAGRSLAALCRERFPRPLVLLMWAASEVAAMATDLAESLGAAVGLNLLFGMPLLEGLLATFAVTYAVLLLERRGFRPMELLIGGFVAMIGLSYLIELFIAPPDWHAVAYHAVMPHLAGPESMTLAVGVIGATVMPHAIYLHSSLMQGRMPAMNDAERRRILGFSNREVLLALGIAGLVNMAMMAMAAVMFHDGHADVAGIETAYRTLLPLMGGGAAGVFMVSLLASGLSSSVVGTMAGQAIMQDFVGYRIPLWLRRTLTMAPALVVVGLGVGATDALVLSQVVLSLVLPMPMLALLKLTANREVMGAFVTGPRMRIAAYLATLLVLALNVVLVMQTIGLDVPVFGHPGT
ncbi:MAG: Nramp family divalent metal transporter [Acetobacteraceae bacterium]|nr:Nramp family divalent metal transporter [Acetobacteraceae bacterium]